MGKAAERGVTKEVRSGEIGFSGPVRKNNFTAQQGSPPAGEVPRAKWGGFAHDGKTMRLNTDVKIS